MANATLTVTLSDGNRALRPIAISLVVEGSADDYAIIAAHCDETGARTLDGVLDALRSQLADVVACAGCCEAERADEAPCCDDCMERIAARIDECVSFALALADAPATDDPDLADLTAAERAYLDESAETTRRNIARCDALVADLDATLEALRREGRAGSLGAVHREAA